VTTPAQVLAGWETLTRMGSFAVDPIRRQEILTELRAWARAEIGDLDQPEVCRERYAIDVIQLP